MDSGPVRDQVDAALHVIDGAVPPDDLAGVVLYGSAVAGGLRPDSDLDLLVILGRRLGPDERRRIVDGLLPISGRDTRAPDWRPLELTVVALPEVRPWRDRPRMELQYGEWLRRELLAGVLEPDPPDNPDLAVLLSMARASGRALVGPPPVELLDPVPPEDLVRAMLDSVPGLLEDLEDDTRNVLLTLARIWVTLVTGEFLAKDAAADWALDRLASEHRPLLATARDLYRTGGYGEWPDPAATRALADAMITELRALAQVRQPM